MRHEQEIESTVRDIDGVPRYWNRAAEELYGWTAAEAMERRSKELLRTVFPESAVQVEVQLERAARFEPFFVPRHGSAFSIYLPLADLPERGRK